MKDRDRKAAMRGWRRALPRKRAKKAKPADLAELGIGVQGGEPSQNP